MKSVFILEHSYEKGDCDETKFIGVYSARIEAENAVERLKKQPGFRNRPYDFHIEEYELDKDHWTEGYATVLAIHVKDKEDQWVLVVAKCLPGEKYQIIAPHENDSLGEFKDQDIVLCEEREDGLFAVKRVEDDPI